MILCSLSFYITLYIYTYYCVCNNNYYNDPYLSREIFSFVQLTYKVQQAELTLRTLYVCVWDQGSLPKQCLGAIKINVESLYPLTTGKEVWYELDKPDKESPIHA